MIVASTEELLDYLADLLERMERFAVSAVAGDGNEEIAWLQDRAGQLVMDVQGTLPAEPRAEPAELVLRERWRPERQGSWRLRDYGYELRHRDLGYRRALHYHDEAHFVVRSAWRPTSTANRSWAAPHAITTVETPSEARSRASSGSTRSG